MSRKLWCVPVVHPAAILRGQWALEPAQVAYLKRAKHVTQQGWTPEDLSQPLTPTVLAPNLGDLHRFGLALGSQGVTCDIETAGPYLL
jgi:hypothetical protein